MVKVSMKGRLNMLNMTAANGNVRLPNKFEHGTIEDRRAFKMDSRNMVLRVFARAFGRRRAMEMVSRMPMTTGACIACQIRLAYGI